MDIKFIWLSWYMIAYAYEMTINGDNGDALRKY